MDQQRIEKLIAIWKDFAGKQRGPGAFMINPDTERVELVAQGVLKNEDRHGFKYCPCRLPLGDSAADAKLICPCNFKLQKSWQEKGECICSLFVL